MTSARRACTGSARSRAPNTIASACAAPPRAGEEQPLAAALDMMARSGGGSRVAEGKQVGGRMEVAVAIGTEPAVMFSSIVPAPPDIEEYLIAGFLRQKPLELVKCETVDLEVPATSEIVLEGYVELDELRMEGPFGDHTGFYTPEDLYPVFHVQCVTHRKNPIYSTTIVGKPPMEDAYMGKAVERIFLPLMKLTIPEIVDVNLPIEGVFHNLMIVSIRKSYPGQARKVMSSIWGMGQAMSTKCILVVDEDVDVHDIGDVTLKVLNNIDPGARHPVHPRPGRLARSRLTPAGLRLEDGRRRHAQVADRRLHPTVAGRDSHGRSDQGAGDEAVEGIWAGVGRQWWRG